MTLKLISTMKTGDEISKELCLAKLSCPSCFTVWNTQSLYCPTCGQYKRYLILPYTKEEDPKIDAWLLAIGIAREELREHLPNNWNLLSKEHLDKEPFYREEYLFNLELIEELEEWSFELRLYRLGILQNNNSFTEDY